MCSVVLRKHSRLHENSLNINRSKGQIFTSSLYNINIVTSNPQIPFQSDHFWNTCETAVFEIDPNCLWGPILARLQECLEVEIGVYFRCLQTPFLCLIFVFVDHKRSHSQNLVNDTRPNAIIKFHVILLGQSNARKGHFSNAFPIFVDVLLLIISLISHIFIFFRFASCLLSYFSYTCLTTRSIHFGQLQCYRSMKILPFLVCFVSIGCSAIQMQKYKNKPVADPRNCDHLFARIRYSHAYLGILYPIKFQCNIWPYFFCFALLHKIL